MNNLPIEGLKAEGHDTEKKTLRTMFEIANEIAKSKKKNPKKSQNTQKSQKS